MILEGLVTTLNPDGSPHLAPMGRRVEPDFQRLLLRPFPTSQTYRNLKQHGEGVLHVTDDVLLLARAALGQVQTPAAPSPGGAAHTTRVCVLRPAGSVRATVLADACRAYEFRVTIWDESGERVGITAAVVYAETLRDFF